MGRVTVERRRPQRLSQLVRSYELSPEQTMWLRAAGVRTEADFFSFLTTSTELGQKRIFDIPELTADLARNASVTRMMTGVESFQKMPTPGFGAIAPEGAPFQPGDSVPPFSSAMKARLSKIEPAKTLKTPVVHNFACGPWPPRNQGRRGTCVSFAAIALYEHYLCRTQGLSEDLSEQFLYWALKHHNLDPYPNQDGTWFRYIRAALKKYGTCREEDWKYNPNVKSDVSHNPPPTGAAAAALPYASVKTYSKEYQSKSGKAAILYKYLSQHGAVGIALPVFDAPNRRLHNWNTPAALSYGAVQDPLPDWIAHGGHAVCCVGFVPDPEELLGGHFIIRNSWGTVFGSQLPDPSYFGPEPGYGQISASHIDKYLWELCIFG